MWRCVKQMCALRSDQATKNTVEKIVNVAAVNLFSEIASGEDKEALGG